MTGKRKALFFDIDGTLFSEINRNVPESAKQAIERAREAGHLVFINSGTHLLPHRAHSVSPGGRRLLLRLRDTDCGGKRRDLLRLNTS